MSLHDADDPPRVLSPCIVVVRSLCCCLALVQVHRVQADIVKTRNEVKSLFQKKKQVENLKIQRSLESKLKDATSDLSTLQQALHHVKSKSQEFEKTKNEIKKTIYGIHTQLAKLKGEKPVVKAPTDL
jgi:septal ring factor EnvC (AmiA/AmiB activator)